MLTNKTTTTTYDGPRNFLLLLILFSLVKSDNVFTFSHISSTTTALAEVIPRRRGRPPGEWPISASLVGDRPPPGARWGGAAGCCCCGWQDDGWGWRGPTCVGPPSEKCRKLGSRPCSTPTTHERHAVV